MVVRYNTAQRIAEVLTMPSYEYKCKECKKTFALILTVADHDRKRIACPKCKSKKVEQQFGSFFAVTSKKS
jgi:putative FmdB family regulatory protein